MQRADQPHQRASNGGDAHIGRHGRSPRRPPGAAHQADRSAVLQQEHISGAQSEHDYWMPVQPVSEPTSPAESQVFTHRQRVDVADAAMVEIARGGVMAGVHPLPVIVRRHRQDAKCAADPVVDAAGAEEGAVAAIVLDEKYPHQKPRGGQGEGETQPVGYMEKPPHRGPEADEGRHRHGDFRQTPGGIRIAVPRQDAGEALDVRKAAQRRRGGRALGHRGSLLHRGRPHPSGDSRDFASLD